jgi:hypothetical protein
MGQFRFCGIQISCLATNSSLRTSLFLMACCHSFHLVIDLRHFIKHCVLLSYEVIALVKYNYRANFIIVIECLHFSKCDKLLLVVTKMAVLGEESLRITFFAAWFKLD